MMQLMDIVAAEPLEGFHVRLTFTDHTTREVDLWPYIHRGPIFAPVRDDVAFFRQMEIRDGTIAWPNGADIDPNVLYYPELHPAAWAHEQTPSP
ncbi:DUF2442 domain-containing protein [Candidatus Chloroploca sp. M-50]|uniref:DUF2442 domain-containing protein n=2 Tax=Candidatus Chloroploca mongolica TaxID=2528176 RepID=A0ABS4DA13_9CHLR|nr:DUF2442 domain-containing protein [Candidatus Chloroploca mongolica]